MAGKPVMHSALREGGLWAAETRPGVFALTWLPHPDDHPDYPGVTVDSTQEPMPVDEGF